MAPKRRGSRKREARCKAAFRLFTATLVVLTLFGLTRVSLSARIAEASIDADRLRGDIRSERQVTDTLEVDRGVLTTPERLATIASASMSMAEPSELAYLQIGGEGDVSEAAVVFGVADVAEAEPLTLRAMIAAVMDMAAGEAEALLVGDVGLASSR